MSRSMLRKLLLRLAPAPADFDRLCIDYAPQVRQHFSVGMDRLSQTNLLLRMVPADAVLAALQALSPDASEFEQLLTQLDADPRNARECELEALSQRLEDCLLQRDRIRTQREKSVALELEALNRQIVDLKRQIRRGPQLNPGEILAERYILCELIGRGGYGDVWQALDRSRQRFVAIKVLHGRREDPRSVERFERGARTMRQLDHPHIVRVLEEPADHDDFHYYVMEYLAGGDLERALTQGRITRAQALHAILQAGEALEYAHARGMVHRDIKPPNILLDSAGGAHLTDFDLVLAEDSTGGTATGAFVGTILYVAPEVLDDAGLADARSDVYALGMSLLFVLYGRPLPRSGSRDSLLRSFQHAPAALLGIAECATEPNPADRYASAADFCAALQSALNAPDLDLSEISHSAHLSSPSSETVTAPISATSKGAISAPFALISGGAGSGPPPSQQSLSLTGFALPPPTRSSWRRLLFRGALGALAAGSLGLGYLYLPRLRPSPIGTLVADSSLTVTSMHPESAHAAPAAVAPAPKAEPGPDAPSRAPEPLAAVDRTAKQSPAKQPATTERADKPKATRTSKTGGAQAAERSAPSKRSGAGIGGPISPVFAALAKASPDTKPNELSKSEVERQLAAARAEYRNRNFQKAIDLARPLQQESPARAWQIIGMAACELEDVTLAAEAYRRAEAPDKPYLLYVCQRHRLVYSGSEFVKTAAP